MFKQLGLGLGLGMFEQADPFEFRFQTFQFWLQSKWLGVSNPALLFGSHQFILDSRCVQFKEWQIRTLPSGISQCLNVLPSGSHSLNSLWGQVPNFPILMSRQMALGIGHWFLKATDLSSIVDVTDSRNGKSEIPLSSGSSQGSNVQPSWSYFSNFPLSSALKKFNSDDKANGKQKVNLKTLSSGASTPGLLFCPNPLCSLIKCWFEVC